MEKPDQALSIEPRWPVALAVITLVLLLTALSGRIRIFPIWVPYILGIALIVPMVAITLTTAKARWAHIEHIVMLLFFVFTVVRRSAEIGGNQLLTSSIATWVINVVAFSLLYWQLDRGGPEARANNTGPKPDWLFPQEGVPEDVPPDWRPTFIDYLFLGYSTATAFSPTDVLPLTARAKMLMMLESAISLSTIVVVASRAINILGS
jgi:hypothetical protein